MLHRLLLTLAAALLPVVTAGAPGPARRQEPAPDPEARLAELVRRDVRLSFTSESEARARVVLEGTPAAGERAAAVLVLGEGQALAALARLEVLTVDPEPEVRSAAVFALGRMGKEGSAALEHAGARALDADGSAAVVAVAWLQAESRGAPAHLAALAEGDGELARSARQALAYRDGAPAGCLASALELYHDLRWRAARAHGLVDGQRWQRAVVSELLRNDDFLDRVILRSVAEVPTVMVLAHVRELLLEEKSPVVLRAAVALLPEELEQAVVGGVWTPSPEAWRIVVEEIDRGRRERRALALLSRAGEAVPELALQAELLRFRGGAPVPWSWVVERLNQGTSEERALVVAACGERGDKQFLPALSELLDKQTGPELLGPGVVARARLAQASAQSAIENFAAAPRSEERDAVLRALADALHDKRLWRHGKEALRQEDLSPELRRALVLGLAQAGEPETRAELRTLLPAETDPEARLLAVRALCEQGTPLDIPVLRELFPVEQDFQLDIELDIELGRALVLGREREAEPLLLAALWRDRWSLSVLAGGLIVRNSGLRALIDQLAAAPRTASVEDLRRVGFAIGECGGLEVVEELARSRQEGDPALQGALLGALYARAVEAAGLEPADLTLRPR